MGFSETGSGLDPVTIIRKDAIKQGLDPDRLLIQVGKLKQDPRMELIQYGNTLFMVKLVQPYIVEVHIFTADKMTDILKHFMDLAQGLKSQGVKKGYTYSDNPQFKQIVERSGMPVKIKQDTKSIGGQMKPVYVYEMDL